ncbi:MAG: PAS domain S-box protein [Thermomicrobiales bacterium]
MLESVSDPVIITDDEGEQFIGNAALERHLGYGALDWPQMRLRDLLIDEDVLRHLCTSKHWDRPWEGAVLVRDRTGAERPLPGRAMVLGRGDDAVVAIFLRPDQIADGGLAQVDQVVARELQAARATAVDASRALRESEARFRSAFDASAIGMALVALDGSFLQVNPALCAMFGYDAPELLAASLAEVTHEDDRDADFEDRARLMAGEIATYQIEQLFVRKQGEIICVRLTVSMVRDGSPYFVVQMQDITPFKAAGSALREAEARYRTLVEQTPATVYVDEAHLLGLCLYVSPRIETLVGCTPEEWVQAPDAWGAYVHPDDLERVQETLSRSNQTGEAYYAEYRFISPGGGVVWVHDEASLVFNEDGSRHCWQGVMVDITDRKLAEEELRRAKEAAEEASRLKSTFLSTATHELRTPLTIITGYVELLSKSAHTHLSAEEQEYVEIVQTSAKTLTTLIDDLLDLARIEAGRMHLTLRPIAVTEALDRVRRMVGVQAAAQGLDLIFTAEPDLPPVAADLTRLMQILINLVGNAIKFTEQGHVVCAARADGDGVEISVIDTGIGISDEAMAQIFDEFHQGESGMTRRYGGAGLGLAIARRLVAMHSGRISAESTPGVGSTFRIWLPAADDRLVVAETDAPFSLAVPAGRG